MNGSTRASMDEVASALVWAERFALVRCGVSWLFAGLSVVLLLYGLLFPWFTWGQLFEHLYVGIAALVFATLAMVVNRGDYL